MGNIIKTKMNTKLITGTMIGAAYGLQLESLLSAQDIVASGPWDGHDWTDTANGVGVKDGVPYGLNADVQRRIDAPHAIDGTVQDYSSKANVQLVQQFLTEDAFNDLFSRRNKDGKADFKYTYDGLLRAIGKFPAFCGEHNTSDSDLDACKTEISTIFAHFVQETSMNSPWDNTHGTPYFKQGLYFLQEIACADGKGGTACDYTDADSTAYPGQSGEQYYGRGPFQLSWNTNYGPFSNVIYNTEYDGKMELLEDPDLVYKDDFTAFSSAIWFYMTPQSPKPSMHDVTVGYFTPNAHDTADGITAGFGTTTLIINGGIECGPNPDNTTGAANRARNYKDFLGYFNLPNDNLVDTTCESEDVFSAGSAAEHLQYFEKGDSGECKLTKDVTEYSLYAKDDYKKCVCDAYGNGASSCSQA